MTRDTVVEWWGHLSSLASAAACIVSADSSCVVFRGAALWREHRTAENDITDTADTLAWCSTDTAVQYCNTDTGGETHNS